MKIVNKIRGLWFKWKYRNAIIGWDIASGKDRTVITVARNKKGKLIIDEIYEYE